MPNEFSFLIRPDRYSARNNVKPIKFYCIAPQASRVSLVGEFNAWQSWANPMERQPDGSWMAQVNLPHGHHQYLFLVDDEPTLDPHGHGIVRNARNERVSLIAVS
ncbi:MAG: glycoside hydrolase family 13 [Verrucomicrobiota bacterium]|nr:glycoside hydrolase family 13 [Verrucomicrobiota bacterium]